MVYRSFCLFLDKVEAMTEVQESKIAVVTGATGGMGVEIVANLVADHHVYGPR